MSAIGPQKNESETLFERCLQVAGLTDFEFEPELPGTTRRPDYLVSWHQQELLFEVKEFRAEPGERLAGFGSFDPNPPIREKIEAARKKFKDLDSYPCCLVLHNVDKPLILLDWQHLYGAMLGNLGWTVPVNVSKEPVELPPPAAAFLSGGKMHRERGGVPIAAQNTTISAILVISDYYIGTRRFETYMRKFSVDLGRDLTDDERFEELEKAVGTDREPGLRLPRVVVHENPYARIPLAQELFRGDMDERYGGADGRIQRLFAGREFADG